MLQWLNGQGKDDQGKDVVPLKIRGLYKMTLIAELNAYPGGALDDEAAGVDKRKIKNLLV